MNIQKICLVALVSVWACAAQSSRPLRGEIHADPLADLGWLTVRLVPPGAQGRG